MSDTLAAIQFIADFIAAIPDEIHPSGRIAIRDWLRDAQHALDVGDNAEAAQLLRNVNEKAALELGWHAESLCLGVEVMADVISIAARGDIVGAADRLRRPIVAASLASQLARTRWPTVAGARRRGEQLAPPGDWNGWLVMAGEASARRAPGAEWVKNWLRRMLPDALR